MKHIMDSSEVLALCQKVWEIAHKHPDTVYKKVLTTVHRSTPMPGVVYVCRYNEGEAGDSVGCLLGQAWRALYPYIDLDKLFPRGVNIQGVFKEFGQGYSEQLMWLLDVQRRQDSGLNWERCVGTIRPDWLPY